MYISFFLLLRYITVWTTKLEKMGEFCRNKIVKIFIIVRGAMESIIWIIIITGLVMKFVY